MAQCARQAAVTSDVPGGRVALTIADARRNWARKFREHGVDSPELDASILIGHALGLDRAALAASPSRRLSSGEEEAIGALARRRLTHEPVARIIGIKEFWSLPLRLGASTLVPRPETETLVEAVLAAIDAAGWRARPLRIADLGTGSGAILLALLSELPNALGVGTDVSISALAVARDNARRLGLPRAQFVASDMAAALHGPFDLVVSNPPYIASADISGLAPEVRDFDPRRALDGGDDGLQFYRRLAAEGSSLLAPDGLMAVELGAGQAPAVAALFAAAGLAASPPCHDLNGVARALIAGRA
jgi:release factor glutamine methyltransferase